VAKAAGKGASPVKEVLAKEASAAKAPASVDAAASGPGRPRKAASASGEALSEEAIF
jgi:hypothetical protein